MFDGKEGSLVYADKKINLSSSQHLMQHLRQSETQSEYQHMNTRQSVFAALVLLAFVLISELVFPAGATAATLVKLFAGVGVLSVLTKALLSNKQGERKSYL